MLINGGEKIFYTFLAAHCILGKYEKRKFLPRDILVLFGAHDLSKPNEVGRYSLSPNRIFIHNDWDPMEVSYDADLSLLEFEEGTVPLNNFVQPICIWNLESEPTVVKAIITGWGKSEDGTRDHENKPKQILARIQSKNVLCRF